MRDGPDCWTLDWTKVLLNAAEQDRRGALSEPFFQVPPYSAGAGAGAKCRRKVQSSAAVQQSAQSLVCPECIATCKTVGTG